MLYKKIFFLKFHSIFEILKKMSFYNFIKYDTINNNFQKIESYIIKFVFFSTSSSKSLEKDHFKKYIIIKP